MKEETRGRKKKTGDEKIMRNDLTVAQYRQLEQIARGYGVPVAIVHRTAIDWYLTAMNRSRQISPATKEDDAEFEKMTSK